MRLNPFAALRDSMQMRAMLYATDGRDILHNDPDGWEISQPWLWWTGRRRAALVGLGTFATTIAIGWWLLPDPSAAFWPTASNTLTMLRSCPL